MGGLEATGLLSLTENVQETIGDLSKRWQGSRLAAIRTVTRLTTESDFFHSLHDFKEDQFESILKTVFLNSRKLGQGYQRSYGISWELIDFSTYLTGLGSPCLKGNWSASSSSVSLIRSGCGAGNDGGLRFCQYWREATDGLTLGLSDSTGYARHGCMNAGDKSCIDVFYQDELVPTDAIWKSQYKWGVLPEEMRPDLELIEKKFSGLKIDLKFLGVSENNLFYKLEPKENLTCGSAGTIYRNHLEKMIENKFPSIRLRDASPVAVYGEKA